MYVKIQWKTVLAQNPHRKVNSEKMSNHNKQKGLALRLFAVATLLCCLLSGMLMGAGSTASAQTFIKLLDRNIDLKTENFLDDALVYRLPETVKEDDTISLIIQTMGASLLDVYEETDPDLTFSQYAVSQEAKAIRDSIASDRASLLAQLSEAGISYKTGADYSAIISGFELIITARDFETVCQSFDGKANTYISEVYHVAETQLVENKVNVYDTGIFNSSDFAYDGTGIVVAVLDTGLDYYHSAFSLQNFTADRSKLGLTFEEVSQLVGDTRAAELVSGLTASDVYVNEKVPFAFDYADHDSDVYPINSDHGTHVSGVIAGKDDTITGVAPNAQLVEMKIFSDIMESAYATWILDALEDCVVLGVDVINMSIGTACGFSRENDKEFISGVYDRIREQGISLVVAASNSFNSSYGSEKNGNLPLTSNPDSATVGSPATYEGVMSVASVSGVKTPYMLHEGKIIYFLESTDRISEEKNFVDDLLDEGVTSKDFQFVTIPGAGRSADYTGIDVTGKIVLVARGSTTFEEKANTAADKGAAGLIIYNNVSGDIKMNVGDTKLAVCSISQDKGEALAALGTGTIKISRDQTSGPFMSDFSSWGPAPDLSIKPEITAHGGSILSSVPGQSYDRISGTSMATPNISGITALLRQYVIENFSDIAEDPVAVNAMVNQLMMSTADVLRGQNGLPYSVRKQGAGLANLYSAAATTAYIETYSREDGSVMNKTKIELGDDPQKTGVYTLVFSVKNFGSSSLTYALGSYVMTEGVSDTKTAHGATTVTEAGSILEGAKVDITSVENGTLSGSDITVAAGDSAKITVTVTLTDENKAFLDQSFANGMYVEGFITLTAKSGTEVDLSVPYLAFYGDWTKAPIFDLDYFATNADELDESLDPEDKTMADAYATRPIGGIYSDYVSYLGSFYFEQNPANNQIAADRKYISLTNQEDGINALRFVWGGLLRNAARIDMTITDDATGEVVFEKTEKDIRKSYGDGGSIYPANIEVEFSAIEENLKNNATYTVTMKSYLDYGDGGGDTNLNNTFTFPLTIDFEAPAITDCEFYTEYDSSNKELRYYAKLSVYDNHYAMGLQVGYVGMSADGTAYELTSFEQYMTPVYSEFNDTTYVVYELTDYIDQIRKNAVNRNTITVACYDYALNTATYEIELPDNFLDITFGEEELVLSPYQTVDLMPLVYPETEWTELLEFYCTSPASGEVARVVNNQLVAVKPGKAVVIARDPVSKKQTTIQLTVLAEGDEGYIRYDKPVLKDFVLTGYHVNKAYYFLGTEDRDIGMAGDERKFQGENYALSMYPSESVTLRYVMDAFFPKDTELSFESSNENIVKVDENGVITAQAKGFASITVKVLMDGKSTYYSKSINVEIKDPYVTTGSILTNYFGLGGEVIIPESLSLTEIGNYAFANFEYIDKTPDEITEEDPNFTKQWFIGDATVQTVIIPEGVKAIGDYAFANLTALTKVVLPSTLEKIDQGAFYGCTNLTTVEGIENVKFINQHAFDGCNLKGSITLQNATAIADYAFANNKKLEEVTLSSATQSVGAYAFMNCEDLQTLTVDASIVKLGQYAFRGCESLKEVSINTAVIPKGAFQDAKRLKTVVLGKDVAVIGEYAFAGTRVDSITFDAANPNFKSHSSYLTNAAGDTLMLVMPATTGTFTLNDKNITKVAAGALSGISKLEAVEMPHVTELGSYAFAGSDRLRSVTLGKLTAIDSYAFYNTGISQLPDLSGVTSIGSYAFAGTDLTEVSIPAGMTVGEGAFSDCQKLESVTVGSNVTLGDKAFYLSDRENWTSDYYEVDGVRYYYAIYTSPLHSLTIGDNVTVGNHAFYGAAELETVTLGKDTVIGNYAFYNASKLKELDLSAVKSIGDYAFSGDALYLSLDSAFTTYALDEDGYYMYSYHAPALESINLSTATELGIHAFRHNRSLVSVHLGSGITVLPEAVFNGCTALADINLSQVVEIGSYALAETVLTDADLSAATVIGDYALYNNAALESVKLNKDSCTVGEGSFAYCSALGKVTNDKAITSVGDYAFAYTDLKQADLSAAQYIGQHAFIKEEMTKFDVTLGSALKELGDNPFAMCDTGAFCLDEIFSFNGTDYTTGNYNYAISDTVQVIEGSLYQTVPNGLELVTFAGEKSNVTVADRTVRISAMAFAGKDVKNITLPHTVTAIGHKAFFGCNKLSFVAFTSYDAPVLEEEYDYMYYASGEHIAATGEYTYTSGDGSSEVTSEGLGIVPYFMWNAVETPTCVYYGANFMDYIGHIDTKITMIRPVNGQNYDSFIFSQYFDSAVSGAAAADNATQKAIDAIDRLPETVSLADKALVAEARALYDLISTLEQKALVTNQAKLTQAEKRIADLEFLQNEQATQPTEPIEPGHDDGDNTVLIAVLIAVVLIAVIGGALVLRKGKKPAMDAEAQPVQAAEEAEVPGEAETVEADAETEAAEADNETETAPKKTDEA